MARGVAINVGANTNAPGFRGPIFPDGRFEFVPIPETEPTEEPVPTYGDLPVSVDVSAVADVPVHLDPEFAEYGPGDRYTYGDPYGVKARPLLELDAGDHVFFYATLSPAGDDGVGQRVVPGWGAYLVGRFELAVDPIPGETFPDLPAERREAFRTNAHVRRETFDATVLLLGDPDRSRLYERAIPLSAGGGTVPNRLVTGLSADSGKGPWWRRPLRFDHEGCDLLRELEGADDDELGRVLGDS